MIEAVAGAGGTLAWAGWMPPASTPAAISERMPAETQRALQVATVRERL